MDKINNKKKFKVINPIVQSMDYLIDNINEQMKYYFGLESAPQKQNNRFDVPLISTIKFNLPPVQNLRNLQPQRIQTNQMTFLKTSTLLRNTNDLIQGITNYYSRTLQ